jgi:pimeloyl-ACP methyl ester carboxylesterase
METSNVSRVILHSTVDSQIDVLTIVDLLLNCLSCSIQDRVVQKGGGHRVCIQVGSLIHNTGRCRMFMRCFSRLRFLISTLTCVLVLSVSLISEAAPAAGLTSEDLFIPASDPGINIFVRNKYAKTTTKFSSDRIVLYVHGATYPAETAFDLQLDGFSWMDFIAQRGWDVYLMDVRGYGKSTRPPQMDRPAAESKPFATTDEVIRDVSKVVDFILKRRGVDKINLIGWSWGTTMMGGYTAKNNNKVAKLVLYGPLWSYTTAPPFTVPANLPAYRMVSMDSAKQRWLRGVPEDKQSSIIPTGWYEAWAKATLASDPGGSAMNPPVLRAPNGVLQDFRDYFLVAKPYYDPSEIRVPVLLIGGDLDVDTPQYMSEAVFSKLSNAPYKRRIIIGDATHTVIMERNRMQLFNEVQQFLEEKAGTK